MAVMNSAHGVEAMREEIDRHRITTIRWSVGRSGGVIGAVG
jgi:hypothetical protein